MSFEERWFAIGRVFFARARFTAGSEIGGAAALRLSCDDDIKDVSIVGTQLLDVSNANIFLW